MSDVTDFAHVRVLLGMLSNEGVDRPDLAPRDVMAAVEDLLAWGFVSTFEEGGNRWIRFTDAGQELAVSTLLRVQETFPNCCGVVDDYGGTWVRVDEIPGGPWWPITDGLGFEPRAHDGVGQSRGWSAWFEYGPFVMADAARTGRALDLVWQLVAQ